GAVLGTPLYMSPEQIEGGATDQRSDLYALGCILYEMVAGTPPFVEDAISAILARHIADAPPPLPSHVPPRFRALVDRLLAKAPSDRPSAAGDVRIELQRSLEHASLEPGPIIPTSPDTVPDLRIALAATAAQTAARRRRPWIPALAAALVVLAGIVAFVAIGTRDRPLPPPPAAQPSMVPVIVDAPVMIDAAPMIVDAAPIPIDAAPVRHVTHSAATVRKPAPPRDAGNDLDFLPTTH
ncbi:MAG TPA: protein kinase, partial [Kofleriaceae bacterium]